ncbi:Chitinase 1 [Chytriomyces hyalinus]|nr:Chitinase 1 [Chytriomyces hyalinus]
MRFHFLSLLAAASSLAAPFDASNSDDTLSLLQSILAGLSPKVPEFQHAAVVVPQFVADPNAPAPVPQKELLPEFVASTAAPVLDFKTSAPVTLAVSPTAASPVPPAASELPVITAPAPVSSAEIPSPIVISDIAVPTTAAAPPPSPPAPVESSPATPPQPPAKPADGTIASFIDEARFNNVLEKCGINKPGLYNALLGGFTAPISGLNELALLMGNTAHESGAYKYKEEIRCEGVMGVTDKCPYGWYHGRGYIQISWEDNYRKCGDAIGHDLVSNPDLVIHNDAVNWGTVMWYWTSTVQPMLKAEGYTLGISAKSINGYLECGSMGGGQIASGRVDHIQCFQRELVGYSSDSSWC